MSSFSALELMADELGNTQYLVCEESLDINNKVPGDLLILCFFYEDSIFLTHIL